MKRIIDVYQSNHKSMEYSVTGEGGNPVLLLHGGHSNCHERFGVDALIEQGFTVIIPSRPGYGNTSRSIGDSLAETSEYYIGLLDHLSIRNAHLIAISAGGPSGIYLASKYRGRFKSLTLQSAVTKEWLKPDDNLYRIAKIIFRPPIERLTWSSLSILNALSPKLMFRYMSSSFSTLPYKNILDDISAEDIVEFRKMNGRQSSGSGFLIDLSQSKRITDQYLKDITCPTLIIHSRHDASVPLDHALHAQYNIMDSTLVVTESWGHLIWLGRHAGENDRKVADFLKSNEETAE